ncbi:ATP-binding protein [Rhizobium sp. Pop5]|uniref:ATP-binding protein n=1 Tax=Rhizobium sp. Pop5 TaxID=1223565 RepID=UPI000283A1D3|nr:ATP-binding protein [Rhizobium sp. Pop5]EJZ17284.1 hypothetical protein RCCGEPOP_31541 [Rhizobium sp. Pop5]
MNIEAKTNANHIAAATPSSPLAAAQRRFHTEAFETDGERVAASKLPKAQRQWMIDNLIVKYAVFNNGFDMLKSNHVPVEDGDHGRGTVGAMLGTSRTGKSAICRYYAAQFPATYDDEGEIFPVVHMTASVRMTQTEFAHELNRLTACRHTSMKGGVGAYVSNALLRLLTVRTQLLIIDDAQYMFYDRPDNGAAMFKLVKTIVDYSELAVMLVGEERIADYVYSIDAFENRSFNADVLQCLSASADDLLRFSKLLGSIDRRLPFANLSGLDEKYPAEHLYRYSKGQIGRVMNIIRPAAYLALNDGSSRILVEHLQKVVAKRVKRGDDFSYFGYLRHAA